MQTRRKGFPQPRMSAWNHNNQVYERALGLIHMPVTRDQTNCGIVRPGFLNVTPLQSHSSGFSLIEMAVALFVIVLLLGSLLVPLSTQVEKRRYSETEKQIERFAVQRANREHERSQIEH